MDRKRKWTKLRVAVKIMILFTIYYFIETACIEVFIKVLGKYLFGTTPGVDLYSKAAKFLLYTQGGTLLLKILESIGVFITIFLLLKVFDNKSISDIGFRDFKRSHKNFAWGLILGAISVICVFLILLARKDIILEDSLKTPNLNLNILWGVLLFVLVGINEEVLCRGYILNVLDIKNKPIRSSIISSGIFSLLHILNPNVKVIGMINIFLIGLLFCYMYIKTKTLWMSIGYHITWNYFQGNIFGFPVSGQNQFSSIYSIKYIKEGIITGGEFGPEAGILVTIFIGISFIFVWKLTHCMKTREE